THISHFFFLAFLYSVHLSVLISFPTRRSSDLSLHTSPGSHPQSHAATESGPQRTLAGSSYLSPRAPQSGHPSAELEERGMMIRRSEEHTSELQSRGHLVCRLLLEKKKKKRTTN